MKRLFTTISPRDGRRPHSTYRPQLDTLEDRLPPNNMLGLAEELAPGLLPTSLQGWTATDLFGDNSAHTASSAFAEDPLGFGRQVLGAAPLDPASGRNAADQSAATPAALALVAADSLDSLAGSIKEGDGLMDGRGGIHSAVLPPGPFGGAYRYLTAAWYQWAFAIPAATNPIADTTGQYAGVGQSGPVWFLAGTFGGSVTRTATMPAGKVIFFPVLNVWFDNQTCVDPDTNYSIAELRALNRETLASHTNLRAEIDGHSVRNLDRDYRFESPVFSFRLPANDVIGCDDGPLRVAPAVADNWAVMLAPLSRGQHTIHFHAEVPDFGFVLDVTYNLTVR